jgi:hypothetical protein
MPYDRFLIAPFNTGLQTNMRPWLIMDDAFEQLSNAYVFRGRVRKRFGGRLMGTGWNSSLAEPLFSRFRINLGTTDGSGDFSGTVPGSIFKIGQLFSIADEIFTVHQNGTPGTMYTTGASTTHTYDTTDGAVVIDGSAINTAVWFYPAEPVMGLCNYETGPINDQPSYGFDTQFAYVFAGGFWQRSGTGTSPEWHGTNLNFFWTDNYRGITDGIVVLFVSNFYVVNPNGAGTSTDDPIWWTSDGSTWTAATGANGFYFLPAGGAVHTGPFIETALIIVAFKNRLLLLNTIENDNSGGLGNNTQYVNRCRYSFNGSPFAPNAWYEPNQTDSSGNVGAGAGYIDATTEEAIVSAEFIKDRLIVYFERSTWELAYTGNYILPFVWQKINTELGSEATFSSVPFDKVILTVGNTGVHACNGANVERIDTLIPDQIFEITDKNSGVERVAGIRDYYTEMVYWTFPSIEQNPNEIYPSKVLVYNYRTSSWAFNDDCITAWGYFEQQNGTTWSSTSDSWESINQQWQSGTNEAQFRQVIAGNQQGFVFIVDPEYGANAQAMQITNMVFNSANETVTLTIIDHTLNVTPYGDYVNLKNTGITMSGFGIYKVIAYVDTNNVIIGPVTIYSGTYAGGGTASRVSNIQILSKQWNPYVDKSRNVYLSKIDFGVQKTSAGEITVDYYPSATELSMLDQAAGTGALQGTGVLETAPYDPRFYPLEQVQNRLWHPVYFQADGECIQIFLYLQQSQMVVPDVALSDFELEGMVLHTMATTTRLE